jgi:4-hydroxy-tetrahydrodipicolinate synthase
MVSVVGHVVGDQWRRIIDAVDDGDLATARRVFAHILPVIGAVMGGGQGAVMVKAALEVAHVLPRRTVRLPLFEATEVESGHVREALAAARVAPGH